MQKFKKLPFVLAILVTLFTAACSEIEVDPRGGDEDDPIIILDPPKTKSSTAPADTVSLD